MSQHVIVIGAGIGGLACAAQLGARGFAVTLIDKSDDVGGKAGRVRVAGQEIDAGPTVFTMRDVFDDIFAQCGARLEDYVTLRRSEVIARHAWVDDIATADARAGGALKTGGPLKTGGGKTLDLYADPARSEEAIGDFAGLQSARLYREFRTATARMHDILDKPMMRGDNVSSPLPLLWRIGLWRLGDFAAMRPHQTMWDALGDYFPDPRLRQLFGRYATYCGSSPYAAPATLMLIAHVEASGVWQIDGGIHALANAMRDLAMAQGVRFRMGQEVTEILTDTRRQVTGVRLASGEIVAGDTAVCNADPNAIATAHFGESVRRGVRPLARADRSLSAMVWYAHARAEGFDLTHHNVFFSGDYAREFDDIAAGQPPRAPSVYVCAIDRSARGDASAQNHTASHAAKTDPAAPRERFQIIVNAPANGDTHVYSQEEKVQCTAQMRATLERCGLRLEQDMPHILATPHDWERMFPATGGALYGRASHGSARSFRRQGPRTQIRGLYCAGGATHPSAGVPMAALSGLLAARTLEADRVSIWRSGRVAMPGGISMRSAQTGATG